MGGIRTIKTDVGFVAATNRDLKAMVDDNVIPDVRLGLSAGSVTLISSRRPGYQPGYFTTGWTQVLEAHAGIL